MTTDERRSTQITIKHPRSSAVEPPTDDRRGAANLEHRTPARMQRCAWCDKILDRCRRRNAAGFWRSDPMQRQGWGGLFCTKVCALRFAEAAYDQGFRPKPQDPESDHR